MKRKIDCFSNGLLNEHRIIGVLLVFIGSFKNKIKMGKFLFLISIKGDKNGAVDLKYTDDIMQMGKALFRLICVR
ncbi:MAG: hypothetical protein ACLSSU_08375 [Beduini sp.]